MPDAPPSPDVYRRLEDCGIDGAVAMVWPFGEERYATLEGKIEAMQILADRYIERRSL